MKNINKYSLISMFFITFKIIGSESPGSDKVFRGTLSSNLLQPLGSPESNGPGSFESVSVRSISFSSQNDAENLANQLSSNGTKSLNINEKASCCSCYSWLLCFRKNKKTA